MLKYIKIKILIIGMFIFLIGISNVDAASYTPENYSAQLYDNINGSLSAVDTYHETSGDNYYYGFIGLTANTSGGAWGISSPIPLIANHTYSMTVDPTVPGCGFTILSSVNRIGVGTSLSNAKTSYQNNTNVTEKFSQAVSNSNLLQFVFSPSINSSYIVFPYATTSSCSSTTNKLSNIVIEDLGENNLSQDQINTSLNNQTNELNNSINNSTNTITGAITDTENNINSNIDDMEQSIIDSNKETQDTIKDQFNDCRDSYNLIPFVNQNFTIAGVNFYVNEGSLYLNGNSTYEVSSLNSIYKTNLSFSLNPGQYTFSRKLGVIAVYLYDENNNRIALLSSNTKSETFTLDKKTNLYLGFYLYNNSFSNVNTEIMINEGSSAKVYESYGEVCSNRIDETNNQLGNLNDSLNDSNVDGSLGNAGSFFDNFTTSDHGGLSGILTAPLVAINQMLNTSCSPMTATFKGKELSLPCGYEFWNRLGAIQSFINIVLGGMLCYRIIIKLYKLIERIKNPEDDRLEVMDL